MLGSYFGRNRAPPDDASLVQLTEILNGLEKLLNPPPKATGNRDSVNCESILTRSEEPDQNENAIFSPSKSAPITPHAPPRHFLDMVGPRTRQVVLEAKMGLNALNINQQDVSLPSAVKPVAKDFEVCLENLHEEAQHSLSDVSKDCIFLGPLGKDDEKARQYWEAYTLWYRRYTASPPKRTSLRQFFNSVRLHRRKGARHTVPSIGAEAGADSSLSSTSTHYTSVAAGTRSFPVLDAPRDNEYGERGRGFYPGSPTTLRTGKCSKSGTASPKAQEVLGLMRPARIQRNPFDETAARVPLDPYDPEDLLRLKSERSSPDPEASPGERWTLQDDETKSIRSLVSNPFLSRPPTVSGEEREEDVASIPS